MKKLVFMFVAVAAISFASCGNQAQAPVQDTDSIAEVVDSVVELILLRLSNQSNTLTKQRPQTKSAVFFFLSDGDLPPRSGTRRPQLCPQSGTRRPRVWRQSTVACDFTLGPDPSLHE